MESIINYLVELAKQYPLAVLVLSILGSLDTIATVVVWLTKSKKDDEKLKELKEHKIYGPIFKALETFSFIELKKK